MVSTYGNLDGIRNFVSNTDCWGRVGDSFSLSVALFDRTGTQYTLVAETPVVSSTVDSNYQFTLVSPRDTVYQCSISVTHTNPLNQRPNIKVYLLKGGGYTNADVFAFTVRSESADVHLWSDFMNFSSNGNPPGLSPQQAPRCSTT